MPLKAIHWHSGQMVKLFSGSDAEWSAERAEKGVYLIQGTRLLTVLEQNRRH